MPSAAARLRFSFSRQSLTRFLWLLPVLASIGCAGEGERKLAGVWQLDSARSLAARLGSGALPQEGADLTPDDTGPVGASAGITVTFTAGGAWQTTTRTGQIDTTKSGKWKLLKWDPAGPTATIECSQGQQTSEHRIEWLDDDSVKMTPPNMAGLTIKLVFRRAQ